MKDSGAASLLKLKPKYIISSALSTAEGHPS